MNIRFLALALVGAALSVQAQTYSELMAAKRAGRPVPTEIQKEDARQVIATDQTSAVVRVVSPSGAVRTNRVQYAIMYGSSTVRTNLAAVAAESAAYRSMLVALAAKWSAPTNDLFSDSLDSSTRRTLIFKTATRDAILHPSPN